VALGLPAGSPLEVFDQVEWSSCNTGQSQTAAIRRAGLTCRSTTPHTHTHTHTIERESVCVRERERQRERERERDSEREEREYKTCLM
jgi:hypothetical protein